MTTQYLDRAQAAAYCTAQGLKLTRNTLQTMAVRGGGPPFRRWGRTPVYTPCDLDAWIADRLGAPRVNTAA